MRRDKACTGKNNLPPRIPPYKPPRLATVKDTSQTTVVKRTDTEQKECDSKDETEKDMSESDDDNIPFSELKEKIKQDKPRKEMEIVTAKTSASMTQIPKLQFGESCVGRLILKQFETGVFKVTVMTVTKLRGRYLYHVVYEYGDSEDMNDKELLEGHDMYNNQTNETFQTSNSQQNDKEFNSESDKSGGETEGSVYEDSDEEKNITSKKKAKLELGQSKVKVRSRHSGKKSNGKKEISSTPSRSAKDPVIDVEAILMSGDKNSVTTKTIMAMTPEEKKEMVGKAGKSLLVQAKKGMRVQALTVSKDDIA